jgi:hypothetical protein
MAGVSRSTSVVLAYLMKEEGLHLDEAYAFVKSKRPVVKPNPGFMSQLRQFERELRLCALDEEGEDSEDQQDNEMPVDDDGDEQEHQLQPSNDELIFSFDTAGDEDDVESGGFESVVMRKLEAVTIERKAKECERHSCGHYLACLEEEDVLQPSLNCAREV